MKAIEEILENYKEYEVYLVDRFGVRFCNFLTIEQMKRIGYKYADEKDEERHKPKEWSYKNVLEQLKKDAEFGLEKAEDERGISAELMVGVCVSWCKVLDKEDLIDDYYDDYGVSNFKNILNFVNSELEKIQNNNNGEE